jgi:hypothetical protein
MVCFTLKSKVKYPISNILRCDERFVGYGGNKAACLFEMYLSGVSYRVIADHFIIHQNHLYEETARKNEVSAYFHNRIILLTLPSA